MKNYAVISAWIAKEEAQALVKTLIAEGKYQKGEVKLSSYRWADPKDHSKGYLARVHAIKGICPELEIGETGKAKKAEVKVETTCQGIAVEADVTVNAPAWIINPVNVSESDFTVA